MVLQLDKIVFRPEQVPVPEGGLAGFLVIAVFQRPGDLPRQAGGKADEPLVVLLQQGAVDAGLVVEALGKAPGDHIDEIAVADLVFAQQDEVVGGGIQPVDLIEAGAGGHIDLAADDGADALLFALLVEIDDAVHHAVVGDGDGRLSQLPGALHQSLDAAGAVQQAVFAVDVQMDKIGHGGSPPFCEMVQDPGMRPRRAGRSPAAAGAPLGRSRRRAALRAALRRGRGRENQLFRV